MREDEDSFHNTSEKHVFPYPNIYLSITASPRDVSETSKDCQTLAHWAQQRVSLLNTSSGEITPGHLLQCCHHNPRAFVVTTNAQTSTWGHIGALPQCSFLFLPDCPLEQRIWGQKREENGNKSEGTFQANCREDNCREEMHPESLDGEVLKNQRDVVSPLGHYVGMRSVQSLLSFL